MDDGELFTHDDKLWQNVWMDQACVLERGYPWPRPYCLTSYKLRGSHSVWQNKSITAKSRAFLVANPNYKLSQNCWLFFSTTVHLSCSMPTLRNIALLLLFSVVTTTELSPPSRWLANFEPILPSQCYRQFFWVLFPENCPSLFRRAAVVIFVI